MAEQDDPPLNWNIELNFNLNEAKQEKPVQAPKIPPRQIIGEKYPKILTRIEMLWCSLELHKYLEETLFTDRSNRQGFPEDVMKALGEIHAEHTRVLKEQKLIGDDVWDMQPKPRDIS
ncbi:MAG: hypothetical protein HY799_03815 [Nitrosomonadales bacterium]|nr:hypothetical protein [Nitrosomonadales bacterium]